MRFLKVAVGIWTAADLKLTNEFCKTAIGKLAAE